MTPMSPDADAAMRRGLSGPLPQFCQPVSFNLRKLLQRESVRGWRGHNPSCLRPGPSHRPVAGPVFTTANWIALLAQTCRSLACLSPNAVTGYQDRIHPDKKRRDVWATRGHCYPCLRPSNRAIAAHETKQNFQPRSMYAAQIELAEVLVRRVIFVSWRIPKHG